jgi:hypothetical protein
MITALLSGVVSAIDLFLTRALFHLDGACVVRTLVDLIPVSAGDSPVDAIGLEATSSAYK